MHQPHPLAKIFKLLYGCLNEIQNTRIITFAEKFMDRLNVTLADTTKYLNVPVISAFSRAAGLDKRIGRALHRRQHDGARAGAPDYLDNFFYALGASYGRAAEFQDLHIVLRIRLFRSSYFTSISMLFFSFENKDATDAGTGPCVPMMSFTESNFTGCAVSRKMPFSSGR